MPDPTLTPDPEQFKAANIHEAWENLKEDNQRIESEEMDWYLEELHAQNERNRKALSELKKTIEGMNNELGWKTLLSRIVKQIKL